MNKLNIQKREGLALGTEFYNKPGEIQRKDLPLKSFLTTFESKLNDPKMDKDIIKVINKQGDRQNHKYNVKAQMTEWRMWDEPGFNKLKNITDSTYITFKDNSKLKIDNETASVILNVYENLNDENKNKLEKTLEQNQTTFLKMTDFAFSCLEDK